MPCYEPRDNERPVYVNGVDPNPYINEINKLSDLVKRLEAGLCALITELEKKGIANEVISQASKSGLIDLISFWEKHSKEDEARLYKKFHQFSEHEQEVLKRMFFEGKI